MRPLCVHVVEDDDAVRHSLCTLIESMGCSAHAFASAEAYLAGPGGQGADGLVTDYSLPGMSGVVLLETLRGRGVAIPAIVVSANGRGIAAAAARAGAAAVLRKPLAAEALSRWLEELARAQAARSR